MRHSPSPIGSAPAGATCPPDGPHGAGALQGRTHDERRAAGQFWFVFVARMRALGLLVAAALCSGLLVGANPIVNVVTLQATTSGVCSWASAEFVYGTRSSVLGDVDGDGVKDLLIGAM